MGTRTGAPQAVVETLGREPLHILRVSGEITLAEVPRILAELSVALHTAVHHTVIVELSDLAVRSAPLLMLFPTALRHAGGWPLAALHLAAPSLVIAAMLNGLHMQRYLPVHGTLTDAILAARTDAPLQRYVVRLEPEAASLALTRAAARTLWPELEAPELVANELASNAIVHTGRSFLLQLATRGQDALVAVTDFCAGEPILKPVAQRATSGLHLVSSLAQDWGVRLLAPTGKTVWARVVA